MKAHVEVRDKGVHFSPDLVRYIISFSIILSAANAHQGCCTVNLGSKQSTNDIAGAAIVSVRYGG